MSENPSPKDLKSILLDLQREVDGDSLEDIFEIDGHKYRMRLCSEEEMNWCYRFSNGGSLLLLTATMRAPVLAMAIREIDGVPIENIYEGDWLNISRAEIEKYEAMTNRYAKKYFIAEHFMEYLASRPMDYVDKLFVAYSSLQTRRRAIQDALKNSSGEGSAKDAKPSTTEPSLIGG